MDFAVIRDAECAQLLWHVSAGRQRAKSRAGCLQFVQQSVGRLRRVTRGDKAADVEQVPLRTFEEKDAEGQARSGFVAAPADSRERAGQRAIPASFDVLIAKGQDLEKRQGLLSFLEARYVLKDGLRLAMDGDDHRLAVFGQPGNNLRRTSLQMADRFNVLGWFHVADQQRSAQV